MKRLFNEISHRWVAAILFMTLGGFNTALAQHTIDDPTPFHLSPGDYLRVTVTGGTFASPGDVSVSLTPAGGGASVAASVDDVVTNTTVGVAGLFDPATRWEIEPSRETFNRTLGKWGWTPPGFYVQPPFYTPTSARGGAWERW